MLSYIVTYHIILLHIISNAFSKYYIILKYIEFCIKRLVSSCSFWTVYGPYMETI